MKNILVATDGSQTAHRALIEARDLAECKGSNVKIINIKSDLSVPSHIRSRESAARFQEFSKKREEESALLLDEALKVFEGFSGEVVTVSRGGDPGEEIIKEAENEDHDLIIMGSRGLGTFSRAILGSVSNKVLNHANKNVLIIK